MITYLNKRGIIYTWQALWLCFNIFLIFKKNDDQYPLCVDPPVLTIVFHIVIWFNFIFNMSWLFAWDNENLTVNNQLY
jgi:hypothetical protein